MYIASQKRKENIAEYLIYMWQIEDLIRANNLDMALIEKNIIEPYGLDTEKKHELYQWFESLIDMMRREDVKSSGHLQINRNVLGQLADMHRQLLSDPKEVGYQSLYYRVLPYIVELRARSGHNKTGEIETCFNALYGTLLMRLRGQDLSDQTKVALADISKLIGTLAAKFHQEENNPKPIE